VGVLGRALSAAERERVAAWGRSGSRVLYLRGRVLALAERAPSAAGVARALGVHEQTVRALLRAFAAGGLDGVAPKPRPGRPRTYGDGAAEALLAVLHEAPPDGAGRWTQAAAAAALAARLGQPVSDEAVRRLLRRRRWAWQRAKEWLTSPDPAYAAKKKRATACSAG
jgi:transposase